MHTLTHNALRTASLAALCLILSPSSRAADRAAQVMASQGSVSVSNIGPSVSIGSTKAEVSSAIGKADLVLPDGSWMFRRSFYVDNSAANGSLVVAFSKGKVSSLHLLSPFEAVGMASKPQTNYEATILASRR
jgi:hypothetical protein